MILLKICLSIPLLPKDMQHLLLIIMLAFLVLEIDTVKSNCGDLRVHFISIVVTIHTDAPRKGEGMCGGGGGNLCKFLRPRPVWGPPPGHIHSGRNAQ